MAQAHAISDPSKQAQRVQLYQQAEQPHINQVAAVCPVSRGADFSMLRSYIKCYAEDAQGDEPVTEWPNVYIAAH